MDYSDGLNRLWNANQMGGESGRILCGLILRMTTNGRSFAVMSFSSGLPGLVRKSSSTKQASLLNRSYCLSLLTSFNTGLFRLRV